MADPTTFRDDFLRSFAGALGVTYEEMSENYNPHYSATRAATLFPDRVTELMHSTDPRQRKRGIRLYNQQRNAQWLARWALIEKDIANA